MDWVARDKNFICEYTWEWPRVSITFPRRQNVLWAGDRPFRRHLFAGDGILMEHDLDGSLGRSAFTWENGSLLVIGDEALNEDNLKIEGLWQSTHIILGYEVNFDEFSIAITLQGEKIMAPPPKF